MRLTPLRTLLAFTAIVIAPSASACVFDEHVSAAAIPILDQVALSLDQPQSADRVALLQQTCAGVDDWVAGGHAGRDGDLIAGVCTTALDDHDWAGARKKMLDLFPRAERQKHLQS